MHRKACALAVVALLASACGSTPGERAVTGSGIGAAAGAIVGAVTGLTVVQAALIGAGAGGLTGALTDNSQINFGKPIWQWGSASHTSVSQGTGDRHAAAGKRQVSVRQIQSGLAKLGYDPGPIDGIMGNQTALAIRKYQESNSLLIDGQASPELAQRIQAEAGRA